MSIVHHIRHVVATSVAVVVVDDGIHVDLVVDGVECAESTVDRLEDGQSVDAGDRLDAGVARPCRRASVGADVDVGSSSVVCASFSGSTATSCNSWSPGDEEGFIGFFFGPQQRDSSPVLCVSGVKFTPAIQTKYRLCSTISTMKVTEYCGNPSISLVTAAMRGIATAAITAPPIVNDMAIGLALSVDTSTAVNLRKLTFGWFVP